MMHRVRHCFLLGLVSLLPFAAARAISEELPDWLKLGFTERLRIETTDNAIWLADRLAAGTSYLRVRTSATVQVFPNSCVEITTRLTNEFRQYLVPEERDFDWDETIFDLLYLRWDSVGGAPISLVLGRQNLTFGEGFVVFEGGPLDGSRTQYFNAVQAIWSFSPQTSLAVMYVSQPQVDEWLPILGDQNRWLVEQDEEAGIAYFSGMIGPTNLQAYFIHKHISEPLVFPKANINCSGIRLQTPLLPGLTGVVEAAGQLGTWGDIDQRAVGGYGYLTHETGWPVYFPKSFTLGTIYLSGDDLGTEEYEGWEPMFGRWPKWSESYIYTLVGERGAAYWTNLASVFGRAVVAVASDLSLNLDYHHLMSPQYGNESLEYPGGDGRVRGDLFIGKLAYQMNPHLNGHLIVEHFVPGNYYFVGADESTWVRMEMLLQF